LCKNKKKWIEKPQPMEIYHQIKKKLATNTKNIIHEKRYKKEKFKRYNVIKKKKKKKK